MLTNEELEFRINHLEQKVAMLEQYIIHLTESNVKMLHLCTELQSIMTKKETCYDELKQEISLI